MKKNGILERIEKNVEGQGKWQTRHQKDDKLQFKTINDKLAILPSIEDVAKAVRENVETQINGNLREIKSHLEQQDGAMKLLFDGQKELSDKIRPIDGARNWLYDTGKVVLYIGALALAVTATFEVLHMIGIMK